MSTQREIKDILVYSYFTPEHLITLKWEDLKKLIQHGDRRQIANTLNYTRSSSITRILKHERSNPRVFKELSNILINRHIKN